MSEDTVRVLRLVEYIGPRAWVEKTVANSINGKKTIGIRTGTDCTITGVTLTQYPEILENVPAHVEKAEHV